MAVARNEIISEIPDDSTNDIRFRAFTLTYKEKSLLPPT